MESEGLRQLPLVVELDEKLIRIKYRLFPNYAAEENTVSRVLVHDSENDKEVGWVNHTLNDGQIIKFKGQWKDSYDESNQDCLLIMENDLIRIIPFESSLLHLQKTSDK
jgi:hypothetical protein